ncbi:hypothetical protein TRVL_09398 [Trypanosoma vivax]|uniref:Uncharacterized protein n=1 Tax=Trypanosoma vivax (strain Y486) TaxID=1055687 RepID=F9WVZ3_TRYVY|nr:hypothetical protein TRVL_09398 [Trypanosoma vivax]CCD21758.1 hypothetical protein, conserved in T. vivax [Trypanosoma vivax Y486]|eukprot:CCD21758.1 hypothetical protein, conserved in T. vivax [Trypanosoma vivax Y486]
MSLLFLGAEAKLSFYCGSAFILLQDFATMKTFALKHHRFTDAIRMYFHCAQCLLCEAMAAQGGYASFIARCISNSNTAQGSIEIIVLSKALRLRIEMNVPTTPRWQHPNAAFSVFHVPHFLVLYRLLLTRHPIVSDDLPTVCDARSTMPRVGRIRVSWLMRLELLCFVLFFAKTNRAQCKKNAKGGRKVFPARVYFTRCLSYTFLKPAHLKPKAACNKAFVRIYWSFATKLFTIVLSLSVAFTLHYNCKLLQTNTFHTPASIQLIL